MKIKIVCPDGFADHTKFYDAVTEEEILKGKVSRVGIVLEHGKLANITIFTHGSLDITGEAKVYEE